MIDLTKLDQYKENNRLEVKKATGGLPRSIWETYSSFANTLGGIILLGVVEDPDGCLHVEGLPNPEQLEKEFWNTINNSQKISRNILSSKHVAIRTIDSKRILVIIVPKADRRDRPIYVGENPFTGAYRRNGEGDYHCTQEEVRMMLRDQAESSQDTHLIERMGMDVFDYESVARYRNRMKNNRPGHVWEDFDDSQFLYRLGATGRAEDETMHPTVAGLLMFGFDYEIVKEFPNYFLDYREQMDTSKRWTDRICSGDGSWSGNIFDFYFRVYNKLAQDIKVPFVIENGLERIDDTPVHIAIREALANCLINADYHGRQGLVILKKPNELSFSNPGNFRIDIQDAISGGISDPRNGTLIKMFNLINIGERSGSGIPMIYSVWNKQGWQIPEFVETFNPDRCTLKLIFETAQGSSIKNADNQSSIKNVDKVAPIKTADKQSSIKNVDKVASIKTADKQSSIKNVDNEAPVKIADKNCVKRNSKEDKSERLKIQREKILEYLKDHDSVTSRELLTLLNLESSQARKILRDMAKDGILIAQGSNRNRRYVLNPVHREKNDSKQ